MTRAQREAQSIISASPGMPDWSQYPRLVAELEKAYAEHSQDEKLDKIIAILDEAIKTLEGIMRKNQEVIDGRP